MNFEVLSEIFSINLGVKENEHVLVFTDTIAPGEDVPEEEERGRKDLVNIAACLAEVGRHHCHVEYIEYESVGSHGAEPPEPVWKAAFGLDIIEGLTSSGILDKILAKTASSDEQETARHLITKYASDAVDGVVGLSNYSTSHTNFRKWLTELTGARYASMPRFEREMLSGVMTANWSAIKEKTDTLVERLHGAQSVHLTTPMGTDIKFSIENREAKADTGIITEKGAFSNLPAGEAFLAPVEGTANGHLVLQYSPSRMLETPVTLTIVDGMVANIDGRDPYVDELKANIAEMPMAANIAELGIGTNDKATRPDNILESEKILGTVHIALGDNSTFGGTVKVAFHQDFIFFKPTLRVWRDEICSSILLDGKPNF